MSGETGNLSETISREVSETQKQEKREERGRNQPLTPMEH